MPRIPGRPAQTWYRKRDPENCPASTRRCSKHGDVEHRKYTYDGGKVQWICVPCRKETYKRYAETHKPGHVDYHVYHDENPLAAHNPVCPDCHYEKANNGSCGCD